MISLTLRLDDEFMLQGIKHVIFSLDPPNVKILRTDGKHQAREITLASLFKDPTFELINTTKKNVIKEMKKEQKRHLAVLDTLTPNVRDLVSSRYEKIKPVILYEKVKEGDLLANITFHGLFKCYLRENETILDISKETLLKRIHEQDENKLSPRQLKRYLRSYNENGMNGLVRKSYVNPAVRKDTTMVEICHPSNKDFVLDVLYLRLDEAYGSILKDAIENHYLKKRKVSISYLVEHIIAVKCDSKKLKPLGYDTVYHILKKELNPQIKDRMREGTAASEVYDPVARGFSNTFAQTPLHIIELDHTRLDMDIIDGESGVNLGRPWITLGIDVFSRKIWCMHISFEAPSANKVRKAIEFGIFFKDAKERYGTQNDWDIQGIPAIIYMDNGSDFKSQDVQRMITETLEAEVMYRPGRTPHYGATIERLVKTLNHYIHNLPGTRKSNPKDLGEYDAETEAIFTLENIIELLTGYIVDVYHHTSHEALPLEYPTPATMYYHGLEIRGDVQFVPREYEDYFRMELLPTRKKSYTRDGIRESNVYYASNETSKFISRQRKNYIVKYDIEDISKIYLLDTDSKTYIEVPAQLPPAAELQRMNQKTYKLILKDLRAKGIINKDQIPGAKDIIAGKRQLQEKMKEMIKSNKNVRQKALKAGFHLAPGPVPQTQAVVQPSSKSSRIEELRNKVNHTREQRRNGDAGS
ncbi:transposase family protein [Paenibacillus sp. WQ 127069]|uniref:Transposase family protein n=1 Tax=Paenibacillus baimaensis TaxID=2982185 RepID=A0ABT2ULD9_9BACL|nr:transposase family protein [Paenibacillus sp. WQ 127069]MCU6794861.1 transposase family protein [Paenibacillus sp. WQ 127069]